jgi:hypothetical protein
VAEVNKSLLELREDLFKGCNGVLFGRVYRAQIDSFSGRLD